uniref:Major capsid protein N-terminal domain-containing protein n=1 Tax=viral metagenome TaxID=1070528 RepID=A0A6C0CCP9_9ZZZZ
MGGGLMQLVAYGAQDIYLTGNPQITFFKVVYRRHTNFSMEAIEQTWNGSATTAGRCTATISRNGDLVHRMYLEVSGTPVAGADNLSAIVDSIELEIGGQKIDKHSGKWMEVWAELTEPNPTGMVGQHDETGGTTFQLMSGMGGMEGAASAGRWFIPLQFWFCRNPGLALPLIALQYHEVKVILTHIIDTVIDTNTTNQLWADYIYLDTDERRRFAQVSHEYLIEQVQEQSLSTTGTTHELNFNHPVKELIWAASTGASGTLAGSTLVIPATQGTTYHLKLNGHDRFAARDSRYFSRVQVWSHHSGPGGLNSTAQDDGTGHNDSICVYSFALKPEEHQPSGTCNFSRIDNAQLVGSIALTGANPHIYAVNYNVLRIMSGMGGLAYSN